MNLIVDVGNTFVKFAVFEDDTFLKKHNFKMNQFIPELNTLYETYPNLQNCIISSVGKLDNEFVKLIKTKFFVVFLDSSTKVPFENLYKTPKTLGVDRIALVSASVSQYPNKNVLIIDAGTCVTYDFINSKNQYLGGAISPGIQMRYKSMNNLTANLPLLDTRIPENIIGNKTDEAIHSGIVLGIINEIEGAISTYKEKFTDLTVILTGGDAIFLSKQLKSSIFANSNFLLEGLNYILQFNLNE
jgi:type III pantothenate kinase